jgi:hypothetical protein
MVQLELREGEVAKVLVSLAEGNPARPIIMPGYY